MEVIYKAIVPLNPVTKKNNVEICFKKDRAGHGFYKRTSRGLCYVGIPFIRQNERYRDYEQDAGWFLKRPAFVIDFPVNVRCIFYRDSERRCDLTNLLEAIDDILVKYKILADDNFKIIAGHDDSRVLIDRDHPRTEIYIEKL